MALPIQAYLEGFEVFARHDKQPKLQHIGEVQAENRDDAFVFAYTLYDERRWQDMFIVPDAAVVRLIRPE